MAQTQTQRVDVRDGMLIEWDVPIVMDDRLLLRADIFRPGEIYQLDVEIWPTCVVLPPGYRVALTIQGRDWTYPGAVDAGQLLNFGVPLQCSGEFQHNDPTDRPAEIFVGRTTVYTGGQIPSWLYLPIVA